MIGKTMKNSLKRTVEMIRLGDTKILGVVERVKNSDKDAGYGYGYGYDSTK
jgi:Mrp family chromosome partitioning ATPase